MRDCNKKHYRKWTKDDEEALLKLREAGLRVKDIARELNREEGSVRVKLYYLNGKENNDWEQKDITFLKNNITLTDREIADVLGKSVSSVSYTRRKHKIIKDYNWNDNEDELVKDKSLSVKEISSRTGRSCASIYMRRVKLGVCSRNYKKQNKLLNKLKDKFGDKKSYTVNEILSV